MEPKGSCIFLWRYRSTADHDDDFRITLTDEESIERNGIKRAFPAGLPSDLPTKLNLKLSNEIDATVQVDDNMESSVPGVFMVGDANTIKGDLAKDYSDARVEAESRHTKRFFGDAQNPFEATKRLLAKPTAELSSAQDLLEYINS
ncbi:hypothetical protein HO133_000155 [Letharia lupina]|uniref:FAD/NAD(P)-binding domain-containing protein n=1 Tax=Letharia lupina TaxID=560253 RepID=A0A8H6CH58_9LECA|nr:uncharacterized protein HO133_000155 [Letharia lupina]KAF6223313.1 hypothetical protein HO133_000155 [Letharia lupina]